MIGVIGDLHFKPKLSYSDFVKGGREREESDILDFIVKTLGDCDKIVIMGDLLNGRNNSSSTIRKLVEFIERFDGKDVYIISGNHEKGGNGKTSLDFLKEIRGHKWHVITDKPLNVNDMTFLPYMTNSELKVNSNDEANKLMLDLIGKGSILFAHHSIANFKSNNGQATNTFSEVVFDKSELEKRFKLVVAGHVHKPQQKGRTLITGSVFTNEVGEDKKYIYKIKDNLDIEKIELNGRGIYKLENPSIEDIEKMDKRSILKVFITDIKRKGDKENIKKALSKFDASMLIEQYPKTRKKAHVNLKKGLMEMSIEELLDVYIKERKLDKEKLYKTFNLIK